MQKHCQNTKLGSTVTDNEKAQKWRKTLHVATDISGWHFQPEYFMLSFYYTHIYATTFHFSNNFRINTNREGKSN